jgi:hypothetical protein
MLWHVSEFDFLKEVPICQNGGAIEVADVEDFQRRVRPIVPDPVAII